MNIVSIQYSLTTKAIELYLAGCSGQPKCKNCHNPELWSFDVGEPLTDEYYNKRINNLVRDFSSLIKNIMVFGGEPLDQDIEELIYLLRNLIKLEKPIWLFTRFSLDEAKDILKDNIKLCDYIKCGRYFPELATKENIQFGITLASNNQSIYKKGIDF